MACDAEVIRDHPGGREAYASCLLRFAHAAVGSSLDRSIGFASGSGLLEVRVEAILGIDAADGGVRLATRRTLAFLAAILLMVSAHRLHVLFGSAEPFDFAHRITIATPLHVPRPGKTVSLVAQHIATQRAVASMHMIEAAPAVPMAPHSPSDPRLAAAHRIGMNVVTEFTTETESSVQGSSDVEAVASGGPTPHLSLPSRVPRVPISWTSVAVSAAQGLGSLSGGDSRDRD